MTFLFPLGLLGLLAIPVIIIIYILQSKYTEQTVTSTYLWHLSDKYLKKKNPFSGITGLISMLLQILTVAVVSLLIARPVITLPGAAKDYCFILDATGSMSTVEDGTTRFEKGKEEIRKIISDAKEGSSYTLISASGETVRIFDGLRDKETALSLLSDVNPTDTTVSHTALLGTAQKAFDRNRSALLYLVTDKSYTSHESIEVIDVGSDGMDSYALLDVTYSHAGEALEVTANVISYTNDRTLKVQLFIDGAYAASANVSVKAGEEASLTLVGECTDFASFRTEIVTEDAYMADNGITTYNPGSDRTYSTLIVSDSPFFLESAIDAWSDSEIRVVTPDEYSEVKESYGLYVFDSYTPQSLPDASVWLINVDENIENSGFGVRGRKDIVSSELLQKSQSTASAVKKLLSGVCVKKENDGSVTEIYDPDIHVAGSYIKYSGMYLHFSTLFSLDSSPLIFAGSNGLGHRQVVFGFDLHRSDIALHPDFVTLVGNLLDYSFPNVVERTDYTVGETASVNIVAGSSGLRATSPSGKDVYLESDGVTATLPMDEIGTYTVEVRIAGQPATYRIYSAAHPDESLPAGEEEDFSLAGEREYANIDGTFDPTMLLFILLALLFIADWGVYCYEKYQLR